MFSGLAGREFLSVGNPENLQGANAGPEVPAPRRLSEHCHRKNRRAQAGIPALLGDAKARRTQRVRGKETLRAVYAAASPDGSLLGERCRRQSGLEFLERFINQLAQGQTQVFIGIDEAEAHQVRIRFGANPGNFRDGLKILLRIVFIDLEKGIGKLVEQGNMHGHMQPRADGKRSGRFDAQAAFADVVAGAVDQRIFGDREDKLPGLNSIRPGQADPASFVLDVGMVAHTRAPFPAGFRLGRPPADFRVCLHLFLRILQPFVPTDYIRADYIFAESGPYFFM
jgi:hypothetical protein